MSSRFRSGDGLNDCFWRLGLGFHAIDIAQAALERVERGAAIVLTGRPGSERAADPFFAGARNDRHLLNPGTSFFLADLAKNDRLEFRNRNDLSDHRLLPNK